MGRGNWPVPADPSPLTTSAILREISMLKELMNTRLQAVETRFDAIDKATELFSANLVRVPTDVQKAVGAYEAVVNEKFSTINARFGTVGEQFTSIANEFRLRNENDKQQAIDRKEELKTALSAAEKAVDKSGTATGELLRQQVELLRTTKEGLDTQIGDVKVRLATAEANASSAEKSAASALASQRTDTTTHQTQSNWLVGTILGVLALLISLAGLIVVLVKVG